MAQASRTEDYAAAVQNLPEAELREYLRQHSGLPGPRANLTLAHVVATRAAPELVLALSADPDEYLAFCGTEGLGPLALHPERRTAALAALLDAAMDERWRVREGVARALQLVGDQDPDLLHDVIDRWSCAGDPLVLRAAIAAICEPRLLGSPAARQLALTTCDRATARLLLQQGDAQPRAPFRSLRKALGYCWSVVIAANPDEGLPAFTELAANASRDARWIVASNLRKARMTRVLEARQVPVPSPRGRSATGED